MAYYPPPTEILADFNPAVFSTNDIPLTIAEAQNYFTTFPTAQGAVNLSNVNVAGDLTLTNSSTFGTVYGYQSTKPTSGTSINNTAFGYQSGVGLVNTTGTGGNTAFGAISLTSVTGVAENNTAVGYNALRSVQTGDGNTQVGMTTLALAGNLTTGNNNTLIGYQASVSGTGISTSTAIGYQAQATSSNEIVLGTTSETIRYNQVSPLYTTVPTYTSANIGFIQNATITYPGATTNTIVSYTAPAGTWLCLVCLAFATGTGATSLSVKSASTAVGFIPKVFATGSTQDFYCGSVPIVISTGTSALTIVPASAPSVGTAGSNLGQYVKFVRIA